MIVFAALVSLVASTSLAEPGHIGCLFSQTLCTERLETCFNDNAFGRCVRVYGASADDLMYRHDLSRPDLHTLEREVQRLFSLGYRWSHSYTQCALQALLTAFRYQIEPDASSCDSLADQDLEAALKAIDTDDQSLDPDNVAYVKFTPSSGNPHPDFADEVYFPPSVEEEAARELAMESPVNVVELQRDPYRLPSAVVTKKSGPRREDPEILLPLLAVEPETYRYRTSEGHNPQMSGHMFSENYNTPDKFRSGVETRDTDTDQQRRLAELSREFKDDQRHYLAELAHDYKARQPHHQPGVVDNRHQGAELPVSNVETMGSPRDTPHREPAFTRNYNTPQLFRQGIEARDEDAFLSDSVPVGLPRLAAMLDEGKPVRSSAHTPAGYTEGGAVYLPELQTGNRLGEEREDLEGALDDGLDALLDEYNSLDRGFKRPERLDVKKPGPPFNTNNYAFQQDKDHTNKAKPAGSHDDADARHVGAPQDTQEGSPESEKSEQKQASEPHMIPEKKELHMADIEPTSESGQYDVVDMTYAYIGLKDSIREWKHGAWVVKIVAELLGLEPGALTRVRTCVNSVGETELSTRATCVGPSLVNESARPFPRIPAWPITHLIVDRNEVTFKVGPNKLGLNASEVAKRIETIKEDLTKRTGVVVTSAGIGDKAKLPTVLSLSKDSQHDLYVATFLMCGVVAACLIAAGALFVIKKHSRSRAKLQNLTAPDTEASKDYQDLCRARMATKTQPEKPEPIHVGQRIASLSRESEGSNNSPSSRSSTSSWSEEPALTNMDISTGHMVLSYMEDHLKNKDRLEQEWVGLCAYEAEPCSTAVALLPENVKKNRYPEVLPYDHARVVLNELTNLAGSDYINASTITDHDPRNPAYIATQGALPHTAPDFWQMVWEQGSVVMVMLTRLTENDTAMCHRYWPEEGSDLYHIYEVHLVSEHIWCDDYLVRSFYLKNLKTGETRTVTQFHFLSWPDAGIPTSTKALLEFRRKVNKSYRGRSCPIVVHCSDGASRTGCYCLIDMVLNRMAKGAKEIDIAATLEHIRDQRVATVATKQQFEFALMAVAEEVNAILKALPSQQPPATAAPQQ